MLPGLLLPPTEPPPPALPHAAGADGSPTPRFAAYGATKRGLQQLGKSLAAELKLLGIKNVGVHNLSPGMVTTELLMSGADTPTAKFFINCLGERTGECCSCQGSVCVALLLPPLPSCPDRPAPAKGSVWVVEADDMSTHRLAGSFYLLNLQALAYSGGWLVACTGCCIS